MSQPETEPNAAQSKVWNARGGKVWVEQNAMLDRLFKPFEPPLVAAVREAGARQALDIGCGAGATTLAVARALGSQGRCTGLDLSRPLIEAARRRAAADGVGNCDFVAADAQQHPFEPGQFDALISRFGVMFFDDPVAAFANLGRAARPGAGLTFIAWRGAAENPFMTQAERAAASLLPELAPRDHDGPGQFAFADPDRVRRILEASGWRNVEVRPLDVTCTLSRDELAVYVATLGPVGAILAEVADPRRAAVTAVVQQAFEPYVSADVATFVAACWLVKARNG